MNELALFAGAGGGILGATSSVGEPFAQLNVMPTAQPFWRNDKTMEPSRLSRFGLTLRLLTESHGEELLMSFLAGFRVRTSALPEPGQALTANNPAFGESSRGWYAKYDLATSMWKTAQCSLLQDSEEFSEIWPRWGSMRNGVSYLRPIPELITCESASGFTLPTPTASEGGRNKSASSGAAVRPSLGMMAKHNLWPTPTAGNDHSGGTLQEWGGSRSRAKMKSMVSDADLRGPLNPTWVEWLMGWPIEWTSLKPLETAKFQEFVQQHGESSMDNGAAA